METRILKDHLSPVDSLKAAFAKKLDDTNPRKVFRTRIIKKNEFGEVLFDREDNETVLGGALTVLEKMWNIKANLKVESINNIMGINSDMSPALADSSATQEDYVCLWGIGLGGSGDTFGSRRAVHFYEREIGQNGHTDQMIPFRVVAEPFALTDDNSAKYFLRNKREDGFYEYYLKAFDKEPFIDVRWADGAEGEDGSEVEADVYRTNRDDKILAYVEMALTIGRKDVQEYFEHLGQPEMARVNSIGLFTARKVTMEDGRTEYVNVKLFSKLNFDNDPLNNGSSGSAGTFSSGNGSSSRSINYIYRVYLS